MSSANKIMAGVDADCSNLIVNFYRKMTCDFNAFVESWIEMEFYYIFSGRPSVIEMKYFTREILIIAKKLALSKFTKWERVGGLYLMFALFMTQPLENKVRIRIELEEWKTLREFVKNIVQNSKEVGFCFYKLVHEKAFDFVFAEIPYSRERRKVEETESEKKNFQAKQEDDRLRFHEILKMVNFDKEEWLKEESALNAAKARLNKLLPPGEVKFEMSNFLSPFVLETPETHPETPTPSTSGTQKSSNLQGRKGQWLINSIKPPEDEITTEELHQEINPSCSLPMICDNFDEAADVEDV
ncbi:snRNA-activating protein complex subunit 1-like [Cimex lectularius]|uniref:snRNA-activating protein complex subunit 1 n=1 Tax=Cimex lectularius TaxID=79782 RepID=A0A8I6TC10_CIMLE|nr:snRNA-activating protein complex subunit 1-like [Cimex lectularius]